MFGEHLKEIRDLMELKRYQTKFKHKPRSVAEHSWFVAKIAHGLAKWERDKFHTEGVDLEKVMFLAINHDIIEVYTGDILSPTKRLSTIFRDELEQVEGKIFRQHIVKSLPVSWGDSYLEVHTEMAERNTINSKIVKAADLLDRVFECMEEINLMNLDPFTKVVDEDLRSLHQLNVDAVDYFMKYSLKDIGAYGYVPREIQNYLEELDFSEFFDN